MRWNSVIVRDTQYSPDGRIHESNYRDCAVRIILDSNTKKRMIQIMPLGATNIILVNGHVDNMNETAVFAHAQREVIDPLTNKIIRYPVNVIAQI